MNKFGNRIKQLRNQQALLQRHVASKLDMDTPMLSKIERGDRRAKREQVALFAKLLKTDKEELLTLWLADKVYELVDGKAEGLEALKVAELEIEYKTKHKK